MPAALAACQILASSLCSIPGSRVASLLIRSTIFTPLAVSKKLRLLRPSESVPLITGRLCRSALHRRQLSIAVSGCNSLPAAQALIHSDLFASMMPKLSAMAVKYRGHQEGFAPQQGFVAAHAYKFRWFSRQRDPVVFAPHEYWCRTPINALQRSAERCGW